MVKKGRTNGTFQNKKYTFAFNIIQNNTYSRLVKKNEIYG
jgi:hypothetical protein